MKYRKQNHYVYYCEYHMIFATKYRRKIFNEGIFEYMKERLKQVKDHYPEIDILEINHDKDHIHMLVIIPPKFSVCQVVRILKSNTSRDLKKKFPFLKDVYWRTDEIWSDGYFVSTVGINEEVVKRYIENQGKEDSGQAQLVLGL
jgi:putative transposase